jgi:hypothetical protein
MQYFVFIVNAFPVAQRFICYRYSIPSFFKGLSKIGTLND